MNVVTRLDDRLLASINDLARSTPWLHGPVSAYATYGVGLFCLLLLVALVERRRDDDRALALAGWAGAATVLAVAVNQPIGRLVHEPRPYVTHPHLLVLASRTSDFSFPSDHAVMAGAAAAALTLLSRRLGLIAWGAAVLMAFARVYIAAHYPWDVLAGLGLGTLVAVAGWAVLATPLTRLTSWLRRRPGVRFVFAAQERRGSGGEPCGNPAS